MKKKLVCLLLCLVMVLSLLPAAVLAADDCGGNPSQCVLAPFKDAPGYSNWAHAGIEYCVNHGLMSGTSPTTFEPKTTMSRAMLVTVLYRMDGAPGAGTSKFSDVPSGQWYSAAVSWAADHGIVSGVGGGKFDPNGSVTREQLATILYRYAGYKGYDTSKKDNLTGFADSGKVGQWFVDGVKWAVAAGLISGAAQNGKTYLTPQGAATREQVAAILMRFAKSVTTGNPLTITKQPEDARAAVGTRVHFDVEVKGGKTPYTYQWQYSYVQNGTRLDWMDLTANWATGADTPSLSLMVHTTDIEYAYQYRCRVTDAVGNQVVSEAAHIVEYIPLTITTQPGNQDACAGKQVEFSLAVTGGITPYTYQWQTRESGSDQWEDVKTRGIGAKGPTLHWTVEKEHLDKDLRFRCVVTDAAGETVTSYIRSFVEYDPLEITTHPNDMMVNVGSPVALSVQAEKGSSHYTYCWQFRYMLNGTYSAWQNVSGSWAEGYNTNYLTFRVTQEDQDNAYQYRCVVTDTYGDQAISRISSMLPTNAPLAFEVQPGNAECEIGEWAEFNAQPMGGKAPYTYQWQFMSDEFSWISMNDGKWHGKYTDTLTFKVTEGQLEYGYRYRLMVTDSAGKKIYSDVVTVGLPVHIAHFYRPKDSYTDVGDIAKFTSRAEDGVKPYSYQWQICRLQDDDTFSYWSSVSDSWSSGGQTEEFSFTVDSNEYKGRYYYRCVITDAWGFQVISDPVSVFEPLRIVTQPTRIWHPENDVISTEVVVTGGNPPYTYQWYCTVWGPSNNIVYDTKYPCTERALRISEPPLSGSGYEAEFRCWITDSGGEMIGTQAFYY